MRASKLHRFRCRIGEAALIISQQTGINIPLSPKRTNATGCGVSDSCRRHGMARALSANVRLRVVAKQNAKLQGAAHTSTGRKRRTFEALSLLRLSNHTCGTGDGTIDLPQGLDAITGFHHSVE
jgi:hypothetical protein